MQGPKWGSRPAPGASPKRRSQPELMPPRLSSLRPLFLYMVAQASMCFVFVFLVLVVFFSLPLFFIIIIIFLAWEAAATECRAPGLLRQLAAAGSFSSLRSPRLAPFSSVSARSASFQCRPPPTAPSSPSCLRSALPLPHPPRPFSPFSLPLLLSVLISPPPPDISPLVPLLPLTASRPPHPQIIKIPSKGAKPRRRAPGAGREPRRPGPQRRRAAGARCGASGARAAPARRALCNRPSRLH